MTILLISRGIPTPTDAQWGSFEFDQAKALAALGHKVIVASVDTRFRLFWRKIGMTVDCIDGIKTYNLFVCPSAIIGLLGSKMKDKYLSFLWRRLENEILKNEEHIDIIYPHYLFNSFAVIRYMKRLQAPVVAIEHWSELNKQPLPANVRYMALNTYPHVKGIITVAKSLQTRLKELFNLDAQVVYNLVGDEFHYTPVPAHPRLRFVATGSLIYRKGFDLFAKAFAILQLPKDKWELTIIGEGKERHRLQSQIDRNGFTENIHLVGSKNKQEIARLLNESDVFVLPSRNENFSVAVLEALACGLPVIASICGGIRECIDDKNGLLFDVDDAAGLANCIQHMCTHYEDYNRQAIADNCQARFSPKVIAEQLTSVFNRAISL